MELDRLYPGHGPEIEQPQEVISWYIAHRLQREQEILDAIAAGATDVDAIVEEVYREVDRSLHPLAAMSVSAHLRKLEEEGRDTSPARLKGVGVPDSACSAHAHRSQYPSRCRRCP